MALWAFALLLKLVFFSFAGGFSSGLIAGFTTSLIEGKNIGESIGFGFTSGFFTGISSGLLSGLSAVADGRHFIHGGMTMQGKLEYLYQYAIDNNIIQPENGAVGEVRIRKNLSKPSHLAECIQGKLHVDPNEFVIGADGFPNSQSFMVR